MVMLILKPRFNTCVTQLCQSNNNNNTIVILTATTTQIYRRNIFWYAEFCRRFGRSNFRKVTVSRFKTQGTVRSSSPALKKAAFVGHLSSAPSKEAIVFCIYFVVLLRILESEHASHNFIIKIAGTIL